MKKLFLYIIVMLAMLMPQTIEAQTVISGTVTSAVDGSPVEAAMVKLSAGKKIIAFCAADNNGHYTIKTQSAEQQFVISFEQLSFTKKSLTIKNESRTLNVSLDENVVGLKEVTVKAPSVRQHGDTLTFNVADFVSKGDLTLEDALKKIPGIEVAKNGQISYMNKSISKFYIEGLDMLGGKYVLATKNLPKDYVQSVEVLNNHKAVKMDKDNISTDVAINIRLSNKAKLKPIGTSAATIGYGDAMLYQIEGTGMLFTKKVQSLITAKYGNVKQFSLKETNDFFNTTTLSVPASSVQGSLGGNRPPLDVDRYVNSTDAMFSANTAKKLGENTTFKLNATYAYDKTDYNYGIESRYYTSDGSDMVVINEQNTPGSRTHKPMLDLDYTDNSPTKYLNEHLSVIGNFTQNTLLTDRTSEMLHQKKKADMVEILNRFSNSFYWGKQKWGFASSLAFTTAPTADMTITGSTGEWDAMQNGKAKHFGTTETASTTFQWGRLKFYLPISAFYTYDDSRVELARKDKNYLNRVYSNDLRLTSDMRLEYKTADSRWEFMVFPSVKGVIFNQKNSATGLKLKKTNFFVNPFAMIVWNLSGISSFTLTSGMTKNIGDVTNLFNAPVLTNYRTEMIKSGLVNISKNYMADLDYSYASVTKMLWISTTLRYNHDTNNVMNESSVDETMMTVTQRLAPSKSDNFLAQVTATKQLMSIGTKITLRGYYRWNQSEVIRNDNEIRYRNRSFGFQPHLDVHPIKWIELNYNGDIVKTFNSYSGQEKNYFSQEHSVELKYYPIESMEINGGWDFMRKPIGDDRYKSISLIDFGASVTYKRIRYSLKMNNILNTKHYSYNTFGGLDYFNYDFRLRGRELLFSVSFTQ